MKEETPELRNTSINPRLLSPPQFETQESPLRNEAVTHQERVQIKKEEVKQTAVEKQRQMENLKNILGRTREHPVTRKQREEAEQMQRLQIAQKQRDNETLYLMALVGGFFVYHFVKSKYL
jgi:lipase chaperone LimK